MPQTPQSTIAADLLRNARWMVGLTQAEVAQRAGVTQQTIAQYERGRRQPSLMTLDQLIAGCGMSLRWRLCPDPGRADVPTVALLALEPFERVDADLRSAMHDLTSARGGPAFVFGGKLAARLSGADVRVDEAEVWVDLDVDLDVLTDWLARAGVEYVSPFGVVGSAADIISRDLLEAGWPLVSRTSDLRLRGVHHFAGIIERAIQVRMPAEPRSAAAASLDDCDRYWSDRDLDHLAVQRTERLAGGQQAIRDARGG